LLTGREIFSDIRLYTLIPEAAKHQRPDLSILDGDSKYKYFANLVERMLSKEPNQRPTLNEVIDTLENHQRCNVWCGLDAAGIFNCMPERFRTDGDEQRAIVETVIHSIPQNEFDEIVLYRDYDRFTSYLLIRRALDLQRMDELVEDYLAQPEADRVDFAKNLIARSYRNENGPVVSRVQRATALIEQLYTAETVVHIKNSLEPLKKEAQKIEAKIWSQNTQDVP
jgi:hypothetical protein